MTPEVSLSSRCTIAGGRPARLHARPRGNRRAPGPCPARDSSPLGLSSTTRSVVLVDDVEPRLGRRAVVERSGTGVEHAAPIAASRPRPQNLAVTYLSGAGASPRGPRNDAPRTARRRHGAAATHRRRISWPQARVGVGIIGCGNISTPVPQGDARLSRCSTIARHRRHEARGGGQEGAPSSASRPCRSMRCSPIRRSTSSSTSPSRAPMSRSACGRSRPASTSMAKSRSASPSPRARQLIDGGDRRKGVRVGSAPDTFLGGGHQQARAVIDSGALGTVVGGTAFFAVPGPRILASRSGLLLRRRRRPGARHGALLHHRPRQPARPGERACRR